MLSRVARVFLVLTSLAPMLLVLGAMSLPAPRAYGYFALTAALALSCHLLLRFVRSKGETEILQIERTELQDKEVLVFILGYLLPLLRTSQAPNWPGLATFASLVVVVLYQSEVLNVNPLLGLLGYHFHKATTRSGATYVILTAGRRSTLRGTIAAARITDHVWLQVDALAAEGSR